MELILKNVRMAFPALYEPKTVGNDPKAKPAYGARFIIEPGSDNAKALAAAVEQVAREHPKWGAKADAILAQLKKDGKVCYVEDEYKNKDGEPYDGFEGMFSLGTRSEKLKPTVKDRFNNDVTEGQPGAPYGGCYVHAAVDIWAQDNDFGRRINGVLQGVMFAADGQGFAGGRPASDSTFAGLAAEPEAADFV
jgi:hypothetical protein